MRTVSVWNSLTYVEHHTSPKNTLNRKPQLRDSEEKKRKCSRKGKLKNEESQRQQYSSETQGKCYGESDIFLGSCLLDGKNSVKGQGLCSTGQ